MTKATTYVALIRGINVGRAKPVGMAELKAAIETLGYEHVRTLLRSGNVVFEGTGSSASIERKIEAVIEDEVGVKARVVVRSADELAGVVAANPMPERAAENGTNLHVMFLERELPAAERTALKREDFGADEVQVADREIYVWYAHGMSGSDTALRLGRLVKTVATDRNWNTVQKLLALQRGRRGVISRTGRQDRNPAESGQRGRPRTPTTGRG